MQRNSQVVFSNEVLLKRDRLVSVNRHICTMIGLFELWVEFIDENDQICATHRQPYEIVETACRSTQRIDGCWVNLVHWSN